MLLRMYYWTENGTDYMLSFSIFSVQIFKKSLTHLLVCFVYHEVQRTGKIEERRDMRVLDLQPSEYKIMV